MWIAYDLAPDPLGGLLGPFLAPLYAKWCVGRMATDAAEFFARPSDVAGPQDGQPGASTLRGA